MSETVSGSVDASGEIQVTIPLHITVRLGAPDTDGAEAASLSALRAAAGMRAEARSPLSAFAERVVFKEPILDRNYTTRRGFLTDFLGTEVPLPTVTDTSVVARLRDDSGYVIPYEHFSVVMHRERRLALFSAANIDWNRGSRRPEERPARDYTRDGLGGFDEGDREKWVTEPRIAAEHQIPDRFYTNDRGAFDKGHIVRRDDVCFGRDYAQVRRANGDTYHVTNGSPQVAGYNRHNMGADNWGDLENFIASQSRTEKYCLFAGPVLDDSDRFFRGVDDRGTVRVKIPRSYWKMVVARKDNKLQAFTFLLEQDLSRVRLERLFAEASFEEREALEDPKALEFLPTPVWKQMMLSVAELEERLGNLLRFPDVIHQADQASEPAGDELVRLAHLERFTAV